MRAAVGIEGALHEERAAVGGDPQEAPRSGVGHEQPALAPVFEHITPLLGLAAEGLHRALAEPARQQGYRFEDMVLRPARVIIAS